MPRVKAPQRNSVHDRPGRLKLLWRRCWRHSRLITGIAVLLMLGTVTLLTARASMPGGLLAGWRDDVGQAGARAGLRVERVLVEGRANTPEAMLRAAIGISRGDAILSIPLAATRARIESLSWIQSARVERRLPDTIVITLTERRPFAIWQHQGKFRLIDRAGQIVDQDLTEVKDLPLVVGAGAPATAGILLDRIGKHPALLARLVAAVRVGERRWNLRLNNGADIMLPETGEAAAIARLMALHHEQALLDRPLKIVDMRLPDRLVVRPLNEARPSDGKPDDSPPPRGAPPRKPT